MTISPARRCMSFARVIEGPPSFPFAMMVAKLDAEGMPILARCHSSVPWRQSMTTGPFGATILATDALATVRRLCRFHMIRDCLDRSIEQISRQESDLADSVFGAELQFLDLGGNH